MADPTSIALSIGAKALSAATQAVTSRIGAAIQVAREQRQNEWLWEIMAAYRDGACSAEEFEKEIDRRLTGDLKTRDETLKLLSLSYRTLEESVDDRIRPALCRLTAEYLERIEPGKNHFKKAVDPFCQGMCRILADLSYEEFQSLQTLIQWAVTSKTTADPLHIRHNHFVFLGMEKAQKGESVIGREDGVFIEDEPFRQLPHIGRLTYLFQAYGFEAERLAGLDGHTIILTRATALRVHKLIGPPAQDPGT